jgi:peptidoglycan/LPS O-acetylase OafA/YrhL
MARHDFISHRSAPLDMLRAIAVTLVVVYHVATMYGRSGIAELDPVAQWFARYGFLGVDIFFPLSGFLITRFLLDWTGSGMGRVFFMRRAFRIVPLYMLAVLVYVALSLATGQNLETLHNLWMTLLFLTGWGVFWLGREVMPFTITWSISVEEFAYILLGLSAMAGRRALYVMILVMLVLPVPLRALLLMQGSAGSLIYFFPPARLDSIAIGALAALFAHRSNTLALGLTIALGVGLVLSQIDELFRRTLLFQLVAIGATLSIVMAERFRSALSNPVTTGLARIGFYSYFIYLFHFFFIAAIFRVVKLIGDPVPLFWPIALVSLALTYGAALISFRVFEGPLLAFGRSLEPRSGPGTS